MRSRLHAAATIVLTDRPGGRAPAAARRSVSSRRPARCSVDQRYPVPGIGAATRSAGTATATAAGCRSTAPRAPRWRGSSHEEILDFYYPGTDARPVAEAVRVLISADTTTDLVVTARPALAVRDLRRRGRRTRLPRDLGATRWRVDVAQRQPQRRRLPRTAAGSLAAGGGRLEGDGEFDAAGPITLAHPSGRTPTAAGCARRTPTPTARPAATPSTSLPMNDYVKGVVPCEMPALVGARGGAGAGGRGPHLRRVRPGPATLDRYYQICDTTACQVYRGVDGEHPAATTRSQATAAQILHLQRRAGVHPVLRQLRRLDRRPVDCPTCAAKKDPYDDWSGNTVPRLVGQVTAGAIERAYPSIGKLQPHPGHRARRQRPVEGPGAVAWSLDGRRNDVGSAATTSGGSSG